MLGAVKVLEVNGERYARAMAGFRDRGNRARGAAIDQVGRFFEDGVDQLAVHAAECGVHDGSRERCHHRRQRARRLVPGAGTKPRRRRLRAVVVDDPPTPAARGRDVRVGGRGPSRCARADDANVVALREECIRRLQHARAGRKMPGGHHADSPCHACHEYASRCASSTSSTLSSMTKRGISYAGQSSAAKPCSVVKPRSKPAPRTTDTVSAE